MTFDDEVDMPEFAKIPPPFWPVPNLEVPRPISVSLRGSAGFYLRFAERLIARGEFGLAGALANLAWFDLEGAAPAEVFEPVRAWAKRVQRRAKHELGPTLRELSPDDVE